MKTYTYSYQNVKKPGLCRGREAGEVPGQIRRRPQTPLTPRKVSNKLFQGFRGLGKAQTGCFKVSDASERLKQGVSRFTRPRKGSSKLFQGFRRVGKAQTSCFKVSDASEGSKHAAGGFRALGRVKQVFGSTIRGMKRASSVRGCSDEASEGGSTTPEAAQISATPCRVGWRGGRASCWPDRHAGGRHRGRDRG